MRKTLAKVLVAVGVLASGLFFVGGQALADCEATPTAQVCSEEVSTSLVTSFSSVIGGNMSIVVPLIALAIAIPVVIRLVTKAGRRIGA